MASIHSHSACQIRAPIYHHTTLHHAPLVIHHSKQSLLVEFDNKPTPLNRVDEDVAARESKVTPSADKLNPASSDSLCEKCQSVYMLSKRKKRIWATRDAYLVIFRVDVEPSDALDVLPGGVLGYTRDVQYSETRAVVGQRGEAVLDVEVVVDSLRRGVSGCSGRCFRGLDAYLVRVLVVAGDLFWSG
jgi:hypothetical protein